MKKLIILFVVITLVSAFTVGCTIYDDEQIQEQAIDENGFYLQFPPQPEAPLSPREDR